MKGMSITDPPGSAAMVVVCLPDGRIVRFSTSFHIGRDASCEIRLDDPQVSRRHAEVLRQRGEWIIRDLQSSNGLFVHEERVEAAAIGEGANVRFGADGPTLHIAPPRTAAAAPPASPAPQQEEALEDYAHRYFGSDDD